ncbi:MAG: MATE family efflux transporter [Marinifilaceae bacterium]
MNFFKPNADTHKLIKLALPIVMSSLLQMAYNIIDLFWVGRIGSDAVAAVGSATFFINLGWALSSIVSIGATVRIAQAVGAKDESLSRKYASSGMLMAVVLGLFYTAVLAIGAYPLIMFFDMKSMWVNDNATLYLQISSIGVIISFINLIFTAILNAHGKTKLSFRAVLYGNIINMILDPLFIVLLNMDVEGAAWATVLSRLASLFYFYGVIYKKRLIRFQFRGLNIKEFTSILRIGFPGAVQRVLFTAIAIVIGRIIAGWGSEAIAAQKLGLQIESITFMIVGGMQQSISIMVGQAFGAHQYARIEILYRSALKIVSIVGGLTTILFLAFPTQLIGLFVSDLETVEIGASYLVIVGLSQLFMCLEMVTGGTYNGQGLTQYSATISVVFTSLRIPLALYLGHKTGLGLEGVWWSISITSMVKGIVAAALYRFRYRELKRMAAEVAPIDDKYKLQ